MLQRQRRRHFSTPHLQRHHSARRAHCVIRYAWCTYPLPASSEALPVSLLHSPAGRLSLHGGIALLRHGVTPLGAHIEPHVSSLDPMKGTSIANDAFRIKQRLRIGRSSIVSRRFRMALRQSAAMPLNMHGMHKDACKCLQPDHTWTVRRSHRLCEHCANISIGDAAHYPSQRELERSSRQGCHLCTLLLHCNVSTVDGLCWKPGQIVRSTTKGVPVIKGSVKTVRTNEPAELAEPHPTATDACFTGSEDVLALAKQWLDGCRTHSQCQDLKWTSALQPPRVMDVHTRKIVDANGEYVALSYVWGERRAQLDINNLPATFEQAIRVTKYLGIRYLWIDALCITDFEQESNMMAQIYGNAVVTLAASSSEGMFFYRDPLRHLPCRLGDVHYGPGVDIIRTRQETVERAKISTRGWCFQERLLSRRVLHFTDRGLVWECCTIEATDMDPLGRLLLNNASDVTRSLRVPLMRVGVAAQHDASIDSSSEDPDAQSPFHRLYHANRMRAHQLTQIYSGRQLTYKKDRLAAFRGILSALSSAGIDNTYGTLTTELIPGPSWIPADAGHQMSLLWHTEADGRPLPPRSRGPSWSWISVDSVVSWHRDRFCDRGPRRVNVMEEAFEGGLRLRADQSWQGTKAQIVSTSPLLVKGRALRITVKQAMAEGACLDNAGSGDEDPWVWPDSALELSADDHITFLPMLWSDGDSSGVKGLVLKDDQRIGLFVLGCVHKARTQHWQEMMLEAPEATLHLV